MKQMDFNTFLIEKSMFEFCLSPSKNTKDLHSTYISEQLSNLCIGTSKTVKNTTAGHFGHY